MFGSIIVVEDGTGSGMSDPHRVESDGVGIGYFDVIGARIVAGRDLGTADAGESGGVLVNEAFVRGVLDGGYSLDRRITFLEGRMPRPIRGKGRAHTFDLFRMAVRNPRNGEIPFLLVDSEGPFANGDSVWKYLKAHDGWDRPKGASELQAFLMVQLMETWLIADRRTLRAYFGTSFSALKSWAALEEVPRDTVLRSLAKATALCEKPYSKGKVSYDLLGRIDPTLVEAECPSARRLLDRLRTL